MKVITCIAPMNMAVIKYWGKRNEELILPLNDSLSCTLSTDYMCATTTIMASPDFTENRIWLNGKEESFSNERLVNCLKEVKNRVGQDCEEIISWKIHICSKNNFPTASGLSSSSAGYACLVYALSVLYGVKGDISALARRGSGSAARSIYGGWVRWNKGEEDDGSDSIATQIAPETHWPEIRILVLVVSEEKKKISSKDGMRVSVETSQLLKYRAEVVVPKRIEQMVAAIREKQFDSFARLTMQDSNTFHGVARDSFPPCMYMNDVSNAIVDMVHVYNEQCGSNKVAYTYDAGPSACLFVQNEDVNEIVSVINYVFPAANPDSDYYKGIAVAPKQISKGLEAALSGIRQDMGKLKYIIHTKPGGGPAVVNDDSGHLLANNGLPKM